MIATVTTVSFGAWFDRELTARGWSNSQAADKLDVSRNTIQTWRSASVRLPDLPYLLKIAHGLNVELSTILKEIGLDEDAPAESDRWPLRPSQLSEADQEYLKGLMLLIAERPVRPDEPPSPARQ